MFIGYMCHVSPIVFGLCIGIWRGNHSGINSPELSCSSLKQSCSRGELPHALGLFRIHVVFNCL